MGSLTGTCERESKREEGEWRGAKDSFLRSGPLAIQIMPNILHVYVLYVYVHMSHQLLLQALSPLSILLLLLLPSSLFVSLSLPRNPSSLPPSLPQQTEFGRCLRPQRLPLLLYVLFSFPLPRDGSTRQP